MRLRSRQAGAASAGRLALVLLACLSLEAAGCALGPTAQERDRELRIARARRDIGLDSLANGRTPLAIRELRLAHKLDPDDPITIHWLGEAYRRRGLLDKALERFLQALELDPDEQQLRLNLAGLYMQLERYSEAIEQSQFLIDDPTFPKPWQAFTNRGWAEFQLDQLDAANASLVEALAFRPTYWPARLNLGIVEAERGRPLLAIGNFQQVLERNIGEAATSEVNYHLGHAYVRMGRQDRAAEYFKRSASSAPYGRWAEQSAAYLKLLN